jgi:hypothetical protein
MREPGPTSRLLASWGITAADSINPRFDLVCVNNVGSLSITAGAPAAAPVFPTIPTSSIPLAALYVPASCTVCSPGQIIDKRMSIDAPVENIAIVVGSGYSLGRAVCTHGMGRVDTKSPADESRQL